MVSFLAGLAAANTVLCVLLLITWRLVTSIKPVGLLKLFIQHRASDKERLSMLTRKLWVYERGSDLKYKTNITLPSFVKSRRFPCMVLTLDSLVDQKFSITRHVFLRNTTLMTEDIKYEDESLFKSNTSNTKTNISEVSSSSEWCKVSTPHLSSCLPLLPPGFVFFTYGHVE